MFARPYVLSAQICFDISCQILCEYFRKTFSHWMRLHHSVPDSEKVTDIDCVVWDWKG